MHDAEETLLHLTSVLGAEDGQLSAAEIDIHGGVGGHFFSEGVGGELASVHDGEVDAALEVLNQLGNAVADEHVPHEESVVRTSGNHTAVDTELRIPATITISDEQLYYLIQKGTYSGLSVEVVDGALSVALVALGGNGDVDVAPPDLLQGG